MIFDVLLLVLVVLVLVLLVLVLLLVLLAELPPKELKELVDNAEIAEEIEPKPSPEPPPNGLGTTLPTIPDRVAFATPGTAFPFFGGVLRGDLRGTGDCACLEDASALFFFESRDGVLAVDVKCERVCLWVWA
jgi:hypothetical protein